MDSKCCRKRKVPAALASDGATKPQEPASKPDAQGALALYDDNRNGRIICAEARKHAIAPVRRGHPAYPYMNDPDGDGTVCE